MNKCRSRTHNFIFRLVFLLIVQNITISSSSKRTVIITGGNRGIGLSTCKQLAQTNEWNIILACRSKDSAEKAIASIPISAGRNNIEIANLDLSDLSSIKRFSQEIIASKRPIHVLACNAGVQMSSSPTGGDGRQCERTKDGFEITVGINHIGHFYLVQQLLGVLKKQKGSRVVFVSSGVNLAISYPIRCKDPNNLMAGVHNPEEPGGDVGSKASLGDMQGLAGGFKYEYSMIDGGNYDGDKAYKDSKLCNVITALELARRLKADRSDVSSNVMNPGLIPTTGLFRQLNPLFVLLFTLITRYVFKVAVSEETGGARLAFMIADPSLNGVSGKYFSGKPGKPEFEPYAASREASDEGKARLFWKYSQDLLPR